MNKRILSVLLVVALLVVGCVFAVQATVWAPEDSELDTFNKIATTYPTMENVSDGFCPVCGENAAIVWEELPADGGDLTLGKHYYVPAGGRTIAAPYVTPYPGSGNDKKPASTVCIHLNGQNITASGENRIFTVGVLSTLNLIGSGVVTGAGTTAKEGSTINSQGYINFFGGTYKHAATTDNSTFRHRRSAAIANIYGGTVFTADGGVKGTNVELTMGIVNMYGGTIEKGDHTLNIDGKTDGHDGLQTFGGNVYVQNEHDTVTATFNMYGGTIKDGKAGKGGNVAVATVNAKKAAVTFNMYGGEIKDGAAVRSSAATGGNVYVDARTGNCFFNMTGGTVSGGKVTTDGETIAGTGGNFSAISYTDTLQAKITIDQSEGTSLIDNGQANHGGNIYITNYSKLSVTAGTIQNGKAGGSDDDVNYGGNVYVHSTGTQKVEFYQNGGTISGGKADKGGNVAINAAKAETVFAGTISGGNHNTKALGADSAGVPMQMGGNLYVAKGLVIVKNGEITDGKSRNGGNIGIEGTATATVYLQNATVSGGQARNTGGNIYMRGSATLDLGRMDKATSDAAEKTLITGGTVTGGNASLSAAAGYGGNIHVVAGTLNLKKGTVTNGVAAQAAGNLYVTGGTVNLSGADLTAPQANTQEGAATNRAYYSSNIYQTAGTIDHTAGTVSGGKGVNGGNLSMLGNSAKYILNGGTVENGYSPDHGNNLYLRAGTLELLGGTINNNTTEAETDTYDGNAVYVGSTPDYKTCNLVIGGDMTIKNGDYLSDIYMNAQATGLVVKDDFTGDVHVTIAGPGTSTPTIRPSSNYYGYTIGSEYVKSKTRVDDKGTDDTTDDEIVTDWTTNGEWGAEGDYIGKLTLHTSKTSSVRIFPEANGATEGYTHDLVIASVRGTKTDGEETVQTWYPNAEAAIDGDDDYFALFADADFEIAEGKIAVVNINGKDVTVSGAGELRFWDAQDVEDKGAVTIADGSTVTLDNNSHNGKLVENVQGVTYLTVKNDDDTYSSYKLRVRLTGVSLRPSTAGIYFRGLTTTEVTGTVAEELVGGFGIVVSRYTQPDENFKDDPYHMWWTEFTAADLDGEEVTGVEVTGIFKAGEDNASRGQIPVYAAAYATVDNGVDMVTIIDEVDIHGYSMYTVLNMMEDNEAVWTAHGDALNAFFNTWAADLGDWKFDKIGVSEEPVQ